MPEVEATLVEVLLLPKFLGYIVEFLAGQEQVGVRAEVVDFVHSQHPLLVAVHHAILATDREVEEELVKDHKAELWWKLHDREGEGESRI